MWHAQLNSEHQLICVAEMPLFLLLAWGPPLQIYGLHKLPDSCANSLLARASGNYRGIEEHCAALMCCKLLKVKYCPSSFIFFYCASWVKWLLQTIYEVVHQPINPLIFIIAQWVKPKIDLNLHVSYPQNIQSCFLDHVYEADWEECALY